MNRWICVFIGLLFAILALTINANAHISGIDPDSFVRMVKDAAQEEMRDSGVPASFSIAQASYESNWSRISLLARNYNNYHGIKCTTPNEGLPCVKINGRWWNRYSSISSGFVWHGRWLHSSVKFFL